MNPYLFDVKLISKNKIHTVNLLLSFLGTSLYKTSVAIDFIFIESIRICQYKTLFVIKVFLIVIFIILCTVAFIRTTH